MKSQIKINIKVLTEAQEYLDTLTPQGQKKLLHNIAQVLSGVKNPELFNKLDDEIWEFRASVGGMSLRLLSFWDKHTRSLIVATHGFNKKQQKTPHAEIRHAHDIMNNYYMNYYDGK